MNDIFFYSIRMLDDLGKFKNFSNSGLAYIIKLTFFIITFVVLLGNSVYSEPMGPLTVHPKNTRYFAKHDGNPVYLTGSHTWNNFQDISGSSEFVPKLDYSAYLDFMNDHGHLFGLSAIRPNVKTCSGCCIAEKDH